MVYHPNAWFLLPFALWLALIALGPLYFKNWWLKHQWKLSLLVAVSTVGLYYAAGRDATLPIIRQTAHDFLSFIILIGSLYVVAGGIQIRVSGSGTPFVNMIFLGGAGLISNLLGTTGASLLLIRPWLELNQDRARARHVVFFIFIVANIGGGLTPIGDPPLLLGFLKGIPFWWVAQHCWQPWLLTMGLLLGIFYLLDRRDYTVIKDHVIQWQFHGRWHLVFLAVIVAAVFVPEYLYLREGIMLMAATGSYLLSKSHSPARPEIDFEPLMEVAILFLGIFATMMPALDWLQTNARAVLGANLSPGRVYWEAGGISSVLDNAPAYLAFASALTGAFGGASGNLLVLTQRASGFLSAVSAATVYFGALTYLGNGPNLMVKAIAEKQGIPMPSFPGYFFKWAVPILLPLLFMVWLVFYR